MKTCSRCKATKARIEFGVWLNRKDGLNPWCLVCCRDVKRERRANGVTDLIRERERVYGLDEEGQARLWYMQDGKCATCPYAFTSIRDAHLDHNHASGAPRAFLCGPCNRTLGQARDDVARLLALADYLMQFEEVTV